tara:strand:+ start:2590 stop:3447 length:858 start_codon:yes stop_codon:yes gene_type:complete
MRYKPMLAHPMQPSRIPDTEWERGLCVQPKLDGVRCLIQHDLDEDGVHHINAFSRTGKKWLNIHHILDDLIPFFRTNPDVVLDGELYNHDLRNDFEKIISLVRKTKPTDEDRLESSRLVQFHCYDVINLDLEFADRAIWLRFLRGFNTVKLLSHEVVNNEAQVQDNHTNNLCNGYEGSILRKNSKYESKRSWTLMKVKDFHDTEATITGWVEGKGKRIGTIGKFTAIDSEGNEFGMPVMDKFEYLQKNFKKMQKWVGKTATFTYFERTKANSYRHPLFKCIRNYE